MDTQDRAGSSMNDSGTCREIDPPVTQRRSRPVRGFVYFISCGDYIKIGWSSRPLDRLRALQTSHPDELEILGTIKGTRSLESRLHKRFEDLRERGEWFQTSDALWDYIDQNTIERKASVDPNLSPEAKAMVGRLTRLRNAHDPDAPISHVCSNLLEQIPLMANYVRPAWSSCEMQTLPWLIGQQLRHLERLM